MTLTQHTSQLVPPLRPNLVQEASQLSVSMSSLIDFDNNLSSQDDHLQLMEESEFVKDRKRKIQENARKEMLLEVPLFIHEDP